MTWSWLHMVLQVEILSSYSCCNRWIWDKGGNPMYYEVSTSADTEDVQKKKKWTFRPAWNSLKWMYRLQTLYGITTSSIVVEHPIVACNTHLETNFGSKPSTSLVSFHRTIILITKILKSDIRITLAHCTSTVVHTHCLAWTRVLLESFSFGQGTILIMLWNSYELKCLILHLSFHFHCFPAQSLYALCNKIFFLHTVDEGDIVSFLSVRTIF
jgi:hypothetical protein